MPNLICGLGRKKLKRDDEREDTPDKQSKNDPKTTKKRKKSESREEEISCLEWEKSRLRTSLEVLRATCVQQSRELEFLKEQLSVLNGENDALKRDNRELEENNRVLQNLIKSLEISYKESNIQIDSYQVQIKQLTQSETILQMRLAQKESYATSLERQVARMEKQLGNLEDHAAILSSLRNQVRCQENLLVKKTKQVLALEKSINKMVGGLEVHLSNLQSIPDSVFSSNQDLKQHITGTIDELHNSLEKCSKKTLEKLDALENAWDNFKQIDSTLESTMDDIDVMKRTIPDWLKKIAKRLSCTLGPNWLDAGRALGLDGDDLEEISARWGKFGMQELTLRVIEAWCAKTPETHLNEAVLQTSLSPLEINPLLVDPMTPHDLAILVENYQKLVEGMMDVPYIEGYFRTAGVLSATAVAYIIDPARKYDRIRRFLKVLRFSGSRALPVLRDSLIQTKQCHLAMMLTGEHGLAEDNGTDRDITREFLEEQLEDEHCDDKMKIETLSELNTLLLRVSAETKKEVLLVREHMERGIFKDSVREIEREMSRSPSCDIQWHKTM